jgi:hypothetical protein
MLFFREGNIIDDNTYLYVISDQYDGIWANASLLHVPRDDIVTVMQRLYTVLDEEGIMFASFKLGEGEKVIEDPRYDGAKKFYAFYSVPELESIAEGAGFEIIDSYTKTNDAGKEYAKKIANPFHNLFLRKDES